jgi:hypothetical protein
MQSTAQAPTAVFVSAFSTAFPGELAGSWLFEL